MIRIAQASDLAQADRVLCAAFNRPASFQPHLRLHRRIAPDLFWVAEEAGAIVGTLGAVDYGRLAYVGLMAVDPSRQRAGIARRLVAHLLAAIQRRGCQIALLDATDAGAPLYEQFGFVDDGVARVLELDTFSTGSQQPAVDISNEAELAELGALDAEAFGADRQKLLEALAQDYADRLLVARDRAGGVMGYLFARDPTLGPWVARDLPTAEALLAAALRLPFLETPHVLVPRSNAQAYDLLTRFGFSERRRLRHMRRGGTASPGKPELLFGQTSFTHG